MYPKQKVWGGGGGAVTEWSKVLHMREKNKWDPRFIPGPGQCKRLVIHVHCMLVSFITLSRAYTTCWWLLYFQDNSLNGHLPKCLLQFSLQWLSLSVMSAYGWEREQKFNQQQRQIKHFYANLDLLKLTARCKETLERNVWFGPEHG